VSWTVRISPDADLELRCFLADLGPAGHAAAAEFLRQLGADLPGAAGGPKAERLLVARLGKLAMTRMCLTSAAFGNQGLAVLAAFAMRTRVLGILGCAVWPEHENWLNMPVNGIKKNPIWLEYLAGPVEGTLYFRAGSVRLVRSVRQRYGWYRARFGD
jgi:hypothetical protein